MDTTGAATPISGMRRVYGPSRPSDLVVVRHLAALVDPGEEVVVDLDPDGIGDPVGVALVGAEPGGAPAPVPSSPELQATTTPTRASPAMNRAVPRGARLAGRAVESGLMQEATALRQGDSGHSTSGDQDQTDESSC